MSVHVNNLLLSERVLLLQGPMGDFFTRFSVWLKENGIQCFKVNLNGGDQFYSRSMEHCFDFTGKSAEFSPWIEHLLLTREIDAVVCFGDCRQYHQIAKKVALKNRIKFFAFEEGYIRPNYITFEQDGVNFFSNFFSYLKLESGKAPKTKHAEVLEVDNNYYGMIINIITYYFFMLLYAWKYKFYQHHRQMSVWSEIYYWILSIIRRLKNAYTENERFNRFIMVHKNNYFVFALQVHNDFQIRTHSELKCMKKYIQWVIKDFAQSSNAYHHLVLKHHPMDRGYRNYSKLIKQLSRSYGVEGRIHYFCDIHLPTLLKYSQGFVTVNSTTGIQALYHHIPVKVLGYALYNLPKLTNQYPLSKFWQNPGKVDYPYFKFFREKLINYSQLNGSFYGDAPWVIKPDFKQTNQSSLMKQYNSNIVS